MKPLLPTEALRSLRLPFTPAQKQLDVAYKLSDYPRAGLFSEVGCVDSLTEYLSPTGWKAISDYSEGQVAQYLPESGSIEFVEPAAYIKEPCPQMVRIKTKYGIDQLLSPEHRVLLFSTLSKIEKQNVKSADEVFQMHEDFHNKVYQPNLRKAGTDNINFTSAGISTTFGWAGGSGIPLTDQQLRVQVAVMADGHFQSATSRVVLRLKKARKVERLRALLSEAGIPYQERANDTISSVGFHVFSFNAPIQLKTFDARFWEATTQQLRIIGEEVIHWDGSVGVGARGPCFSSTDKATADFVQFCWSSMGVTASIRRDTRDKYRGGICYEVRARGANRPRGTLTFASHTNKTVWREPSTDGFKYCFTVPSSFLLLRRNNCIFATGNTGKTFMATLIARIWGGRNYIAMPPILIDQWAKWLVEVGFSEDQIGVYRGPKRQASLLTKDWVLMSHAIFRDSRDLIKESFDQSKDNILIDESHALKNPQSVLYKSVSQIAGAEGKILLMTGTPTSKPSDAYAYIKLKTPRIYRSFGHFENLHVADRDFFNTVTEWKNLDQLAENLALYSVKLTKEDIFGKGTPPMVTPFYYKLSDKHYKLYTKLAEEQLLLLGNGDKIDATTSQRLYHALQQIIVNLDFYSGDPEAKSAAYDVIDQYIESIDATSGNSSKAIIWTYYQKTSQSLVAYLKKRHGDKAVACAFGGVDSQKGVDAVMFDDQCRIFVGVPRSCGAGLNLQHVAHTELFIETPIIPLEATQAMGRIDRPGQTKVCDIKFGTAHNTVQVKLFNDLLKKDDLVGRVEMNQKTLRAAIFGGA